MGFCIEFDGLLWSNIPSNSTQKLIKLDINSRRTLYKSAMKSSQKANNKVYWRLLRYGLHVRNLWFSYHKPMVYAAETIGLWWRNKKRNAIGVPLSVLLLNHDLEPAARARYRSEVRASSALFSLNHDLELLARARYRSEVRASSHFTHLITTLSFQLELVHAR